MINKVFNRMKWDTLQINEFGTTGKIGEILNVEYPTVWISREQ